MPTIEAILITTSVAPVGTVETAKANGLIPFDYLVKCLEELSQPKPDIE